MRDIGAGVAIGQPGQLGQAAADILLTLGDADLTWDYLTTPVGLHPNEADPWAALAERLITMGDRELADRAYAAAFEAEPTNAQVRWQRAQKLRRAGQPLAARKLLRRLAAGRWPAHFQWLASQARAELERP